MRKPTDDNPDGHDGDGEEEESVQRGEPGGHGCRLLFTSRHDPQLHDLRHIFVEESVLLPNDVKLNYPPEKSLCTWFWWVVGNELSNNSLPVLSLFWNILIAVLVGVAASWRLVVVEVKKS